MPFGLPTAANPQLTGVRPYHTAKSAVQQPQGFASAARALSPMLKTARQTLTQLPGPMQALGGLSLQGTGINGVERLAMAGGNSSEKKTKKKPNRSEAGKAQQKEAARKRNGEVSKLLKQLGIKLKKPNGKYWTLTEECVI